jgi:hypothetical protein
MSGAVSLLPLYAFVVWIGKILPLLCYSSIDGNGIQSAAVKTGEAIK